MARVVLPKGTHTLEEIKYADDVKDAITLANRIARKNHRKAPSDRDYFLGLLQTQHRFNRLDALLRALDISGRDFRQTLKASINEPSPDQTSSVLRNSEQLAKAANPGTLVVLEVEHLLKAFCLNADPVISQLVKAHQLTPDRVELATRQIERKKGLRTTLALGREFVEVVAFVLFFLVLIKSFLGELRLIPSESMLPGLQVEDRLVIERLSQWTRPYQRGDVLVFYPPMTELRNDPWSVFLRATGFSGLIYKKEDNIDVAYIKRLIGLPGELVDVRPGDGVYVNGKKLNEPYINEIGNTCTLVKSDQFARDASFCGPVKVPPGHYYLMGDNRNLSLDSRYWGFASKDRVIGRAVFRIWPPERIGLLQKVPESY